MKKKRILYIYKKVIRENPKHIVLLVIFSILKSLIVLIPPYLLMLLLDGLQNAISIKNICLLAISIIVAAGVGSLLQLLLSWKNVIIRNKVYEKFQKESILHLFQLEGKSISSMELGECLTVFLQDVEQITFFTSGQFYNYLLSVISALCMLLIIPIYNVKVFVVCILWLPIIGLLQFVYDKKVKNRIEENRQSYNQLVELIQSVLVKITPCILSGSNKYLLSKYDDTLEYEMNNRRKSEMTIRENSEIVDFLCTIYTTMVLIFGGISVIQGQMSIGALLACYSYVQVLLVPIVNAASVFSQLQEVKISMNRLNDFLEKPIVASGKYVLDERIGCVEVRDLSFSYSTNEILRGITLQFQKGITGIVGVSGSGKSTIVALLNRLWDANKGKVCIDSKDYCEIDIESLRSKVCIVPQDNFLFQDTIWNNIALGKDLSEATMQEICKAVCIYDWIMEQEEKYNTILDMSGAKLSGGQKQKLALARALIQDKEILILDEAMSALDYITEKQIWVNIQKYISEKIVIVITHRIQMMTSANSIYLIKDGRVVNSGTHMELLCDKYYKELLAEKEIDSVR